MGTRGQRCLLFDELKLFIGADLSWGVDLLPFTGQMRLILPGPGMIRSLFKGADLLETLLPDIS